MNTIHQHKPGALIIFLVLTFFAVPAMAGSHAQDNRHGEDFGRHEEHRDHQSLSGLWQNPEIAEKLGLSDKQITELKNADFTFRKQQLELKAQLNMLHLEMEKAFSEQKLNETAVRELAGKMADVQGKMFVQNIESRLAATKYLTEEQLIKFQADFPRHHGGKPQDQQHDMAHHGNEKSR
ncbi:MAG: hypothetical protein KKA54_20595 [Proteobacteria bacterium]|nr:hypothetical protein [Pseudomonadota bacterium]